jgi:hypothetical protein
MNHSLSVHVEVPALLTSTLSPDHRPLAAQRLTA